MVAREERVGRGAPRNAGIEQTAPFVGAVRRAGVVGVREKIDVRLDHHREPIGDSFGNRRAFVAVGPSRAGIDLVVLRIDAELDIGRVGVRVGRDERRQRIVAGEIAVVVTAVVEAFVFQDKGDGRRLANGRALGSAGGLC